LYAQIACSDVVKTIFIRSAPNGLRSAPSRAETGRAPNDPAGAMFGPQVLVNGGGVQFNSFKRWGDYSAMTIDPTDDCTFWYTQEYYAVTGSFNWATRIGSFKFDSCKGRGK
jgi:hypothetical protein